MDPPQANQVCLGAPGDGPPKNAGLKAQFFRRIGRIDFGQFVLKKSREGLFQHPVRSVGLHAGGLGRGQGSQAQQQVAGHLAAIGSRGALVVDGLHG